MKLTVEGEGQPMYDPHFGLYCLNWMQRKMWVSSDLMLRLQVALYFSHFPSLFMGVRLTGQTLTDWNLKHSYCRYLLCTLIFLVYSYVDGIAISVGGGNCIFRSNSKGLLDTESYHEVARKAVVDTVVNN